jgi:p-hydroxybenzoate 3-monooxygenase
VTARARAGFLAANTVRVLEENGLAGGLRAGGRRHGTCAFRADGIDFELAYDRLGRCEAHTVFPQQELVGDLIASFIDRGGEITFETEVLSVEDIASDRPSLTCRAPDGSPQRFGARYVAGCDGQHGVSRRAMPSVGIRRYDRDHRISWLAVLARAPQSMPATVYAIHEDGFAGHMARSEEVTRYYLQCRRGEDPEQWSDDRIWSELGRRMLVGPDADQRADPSRVSSVRMSERAGVHPGERRQRDGGTRSLSASKPEREEGGMTAKLNTFLIVRLLTLTASNRRGRHTHRRQATAAS